ncbi:MAG: hypothetical protein IJY61_02310 [Candidatus Gastranaerophilales bacterium]|nr:hypothetical protein [Candidatus Gastranaerophilales bacterium]
MQNFISKNLFYFSNQLNNAKTQRNNKQEQLIKDDKLNIFEETDYYINSSIEDLENIINGLDYVIEKNANMWTDTAYSIYSANEEQFGIKGAIDYFEHNLNENTGKNHDIIQTTIETFNTLNIDTLDKIRNVSSDYAKFMYTEEYKNYTQDEDTLLIEDKETVENCLDICDYMNLGFSIDPKTNIYNENSEWKEVESTTNNDTGFYGKVYVNEDTKEIIIGYCGSNKLDDYTTDDLTMMLKDVPEQYTDALNLYKKYAENEEYKDYKMTLTGHSLGGSLAQLVASTEGVSNKDNPPKVVTFNAFGTYDIVKNQEDNDKYDFVEQSELDDTNVYNYITEGDFVSCTTRQIGKTTVVENKSPFGHMTASLHSYFSPEKYEL